MNKLASSLLIKQNLFSRTIWICLCGSLGILRYQSLLINFMSRMCLILGVLKGRWLIDYQDLIRFSTYLALILIRLYLRLLNMYTMFIILECSTWNDARYCSIYAQESTICLALQSEYTIHFACPKIHLSWASDFNLIYLAHSIDWFTTALWPSFQAYPTTLCYYHDSQPII